MDGACSLLAWQRPSLLLLTVRSPRHTVAVTSAATTDKSKSSSVIGGSPGTPPATPLPDKANSGRSGFGSAVLKESKKKKKDRVRERGSVIRRNPLQRPVLLTGESGESKEGNRTNENAFLLAWLGLGFLILVEGIALAASGFLLEEWDTFLVKYLYPSFTPTVVLFVGGTVAYGVSKYLQSAKAKS